jgi:hypothetical protein
MSCFTRNCPVVEIIDAQVKQDIQDEGEIKKGEVESIHFFTHPVLHTHFNPEKPEGLDQQVQQDQQGQVGDETLFQTRSKRFFNSIQM